MLRYVAFALFFSLSFPPQDGQYYEDSTDEDVPLLPGFYRALYAFEPEGSAEVGLVEDKIVIVVGRDGGVGWAVVVVENMGDDGVWQNDLSGDGKEKHGLVPESYLEAWRNLRVTPCSVRGLVDCVKELGRKNVQDLITMIQWNEENSIRFLCVSSNMFPFASHPIYGYSLSYASDLLSQAGALAAKYGHRLTSHPGQFTQLGSPKPGVIEASIRELKYHTEMMELMGVGKDGVLVIHGGGVYDDKEKTLGRIKETIRDKLPRNVRERLVLENDEFRSGGQPGDSIVVEFATTPPHGADLNKENDVIAYPHPSNFAYLLIRLRNHQQPTLTVA
ncbi:UvdE-domain-containing protein [Dendrothele bispora CBS 962.96]|uniref:UvdE-domain-containing protein n=1 Tax=Dendrothele bispora (strain CBS 962.96) TaxID=1314807 RepID=A0A4S8L3K4_DENBC|nr:UvdE-domain-containing protein [Dendrothele bispora CBS 962.96]